MRVRSLHRRGLLAASVALTIAAAVRAEVPADPAASVTTTRSPADVTKSLRQIQAKIGPVLSDPTVYSDPAKRDAARGTCGPLLQQLDATFDELAAARHAPPRVYEQAHLQILGDRAALGDPAATARLDAMAADPDPATSLRAKTAQLNVGWMRAGPDADAQARLVTAAEPLAAAHRDSMPLTQTLTAWAESAATPELVDRLLDLTTKVMNNPASAMAESVKQEVVNQRQLEQKYTHQPLVITGTTADGKPFSTADYKGKVVLVDFWATWCGPCVAGLPDVKRTYEKYHKAGLEVVGVSNDYSAAALTAFTGQHDMPWPQLFDADAAGTHHWNPVTRGFGLNAIPHMFVLDRQGMLISANARATYPQVIAAALGRAD